MAFYIFKQRRLVQRARSLALSLKYQLIPKSYKLKLALAATLELVYIARVIYYITLFNITLSTQQLEDHLFSAKSNTT